MAEERQILLDIRVRAKDAQKQLEEVNKRLLQNSNSQKELAKQLKAGEISVDQYAQALTAVRLDSADLRKEQASLTRQLQNTTKATNAAEGSNEQLRAQLALLNAEYDSLSKAERENSERGKELTIQTRQLSDALLESESATGRNQRNVGNYQSALAGLGQVLGNVVPGFSNLQQGLGGAAQAFQQGGGAAGGFSGILSKLGGPIGLLVAGLTALVTVGVKAAQAIANITREFEPLRRQVNQLTGAEGDSLNELTARIKATADTFGKDFQEVLKAANAVSQQFGISLTDALAQIDEGFLNGADASGQYLDILTEYPAQLAAVGLSFEDANALILQQTQEGIFSDKGIDAIKEAGLRIRELAPATRDALEGIGLSADAIQKGLEEGSVSLFDVIQQVGSRLGELEADSPAVGAALADIFGGPGEDAGIEYLKTLGRVDGGLAGITKASDEFVDAQRRDLEITRELAESKTELAENFAPVVRLFDNFGKQVLTGLIGALNTVVEFFTVTLPSAFAAFNVGLEAVGANVTAFVNRTILDAKIAAKEVQNFFSFSDTVQNELDNLKAQRAAVSGEFRDIGASVVDAYNQGVASRKVDSPVAAPAARVQGTGRGNVPATGSGGNTVEQARREEAERQEAILDEQRKAIETRIAFEELALIEIQRVRESGLVEAAKIDEQELERKKRRIDLETQLALVGLDQESIQARLIVARAEEEKLAIVREFRTAQLEFAAEVQRQEAQLLADGVSASVAANEAIAVATRQRIEEELKAEQAAAEQTRQIRLSTADAIGQIESAIAAGDVEALTNIADQLVGVFTDAGIDAKDKFVAGIGGAAAAAAGVIGAVAENIEVVDRESAERQRKLQIAQLIFSGISSAAQALFRSMATFPFPVGQIVGAAQAAFIGGVTAAQVAKLRSEPLGFAEGGFTGPGLAADPNAPGHRVAGVVHGNEWVAPAWQVQHPTYAPMIQALEAGRVRGYASGGFVGAKAAAVEVQNQVVMGRDLLTAIERMPAPVVSVKEITARQTRVKVKETLGTL